MPTTSPLFSALELGAMTLPNRIVMALLTRCRADTHHVPMDLMATCYAQRASAGLIIDRVGYGAAEANAAVGDGTLQAVAFCHHYVSNPDLVAELHAGAVLAEPDASTFYSHDARGYTDYPTMRSA